MKYEADVTFTFTITHESENEETYVEEILEKVHRLDNFLKFTAGPWKKVYPTGEISIYDDKNNTVWYD